MGPLRARCSRLIAACLSGNAPHPLVIPAVCGVSPASMPPSTDSSDPFPEWTRRLRASDHSALTSVFDATHDGLVGYALRFVRDTGSAHDIVQTAFIRLWEHRETLEPARSIRGWLYQTVRNLALTRLRDDRRHEASLAAWDDAPLWRDPGPEALLAASELGRSMAEWMAELPERQREALTLSRFEGLTHEEIATVMDIAPRTVNNHLVRGLQALRVKLDKAEQQELT